MSAVLEIEKSVLLPENKASNGVFNEYRLRVEDYEKMIEFGIFNDDDKIELWEGKLVTMSPKGTKHTVSTRKAYKLANEILGKQAEIISQDPIKLDDFSEPEPDLSIVRTNDYLSSHPTPEDIFLVMEVADTTVLRDREKAKNYARNGIRQYLILNLNTNEIEDYREPAEDGYRFKKTYSENESFNLVAFPDVEIKVSDLLPPSETNEQ
ncbi:MAG: Uma2 family endonuclease [Pyrinomonadaceae bacterium]|jgi:Uma2 family endonuclease|nr:Uma2 family endonuclease [Pyrinomonadaceae bacterium]